MADLTRKELEAFAEAEARRQQVPPQLVKAMIDVESNWKIKARSSKDAAGLMQLIPSTARAMGVTDPNDPVQNIRGGVAYIKQQINRFGDLGLALAAYNWGPKRAAQLEANPRGTRIAEETLNYVPEVFARMRKYGPMLAPSAFTVALYPLMKSVLANDTLTTVRNKLGLRATKDVAADIRAGNVPAPSDAPAQQVSPGPQGGGGLPAAPPPPQPAQRPESELAQEAPVGQEGALSQELPAVEGVVLPQQAQLPAVRAPVAPTFDAYLRSQFGPLADVADPFPSDYDAELERLIDRA